MIDADSPSGAWRQAIAAKEQREAANAAITQRNARIQAAWRNGEEPEAIAAREGIGVSYVRQIGPRWQS